MALLAYVLKIGRKSGGEEVKVKWVDKLEKEMASVVKNQLLPVTGHRQRFVDRHRRVHASVSRRTRARNRGRHTFFIRTSFERKEDLLSPHEWDQRAPALRVVVEFGSVPAVCLP